MFRLVYGMCSAFVTVNFKFYRANNLSVKFYRPIKLISKLTVFINFASIGISIDDCLLIRN